MPNFDQKEYQSVVLGALLHDVGKFMQRTHNSNNELPTTSRDAAVNLCPLYRGNYSRQHVLWTDAFFEWFENEKATFPDGFDFMIAKMAAIYHHQPEHHPNPSIGWICAEADRLSSGMDRKEKDEEEELASGWRAFKKIPLQSIFDRVNMGNHIKTGKYFYNLKRLSGFKNIFPAEKTPPFNEELDYLSLWEPFLKDFKRACSINNREIFINAVASILEEYTWAIPSSTMDLPDISLFDHSLTTAAIASTIYRYHKDTDTFNTNAIKDRETSKFRIVAGDISGIQNFIFRLQKQSVKGVNKILRARSFYIRTITEAISHWILKQMGMLDINKVMDAGGRFYLLVPNTERCKVILDNSIQIIEKWMKNEFLGELTLNLDYSVTACGIDFNLKEGSFASLIDKVNDQLEVKKNQRYMSIKGLYEPVFKEISYSDEDGFNGACSICGTMPAKKDLKISKDEEAVRSICEQCNVLKELGGELPSAKYIAFFDKPVEKQKLIPFFNGNCFVRVYKKSDTPLKLAPNMIFQVNGDFEGLPIKHIANYVPRFAGEDINKRDTFYKDLGDEEKNQIKENNPKTFHHLAAEARRFSNDNSNEKKLIGKDFLGLFKADVDNLGLLFSIGVEEEDKSDLSISRFSFMSRMLDIFFAGYLQNKIQKDYRNIYTVFSGGDDLFLIGPWPDIIKLAGEVNESFRRFTGWNKDIKLSAGIELIKSKYPINRGAAMAEEALEKSKEEGKNKISLFKTTVQWKRLSYLMKYGKKLEEAIEDSNSDISIGMIYRLLFYHEMEERVRNRTFKDRDFLWRSHLAYDINRNIGSKKDRGRKQEDMELLFQLAGDEYDSEAIMPYLKVPVFWTLYRNRT